MPQGILDRLKGMLERDKTVQMVANDPTLTAELLLLFRMILADGAVQTAELAVFKRICRDVFGLNPDAMDGVYKYLEDYAYETTNEQSVAMFAGLPVERRKMLLDNMIAIAESDDELDPDELRLLGRTADMLGFDIKGN